MLIRLIKNAEQICVWKYRIKLPVKKGFRIAVAADVHATERYETIIELIRHQLPDMIFIPGDLCHYSDQHTVPLEFLRLAARISPVYYSFGNHERRTDESAFDMDGVHILNDRWEMFGEVVIGGLRSGFRGQAENAVMKTPVPNLEFLDHFESLSGVKLLLCHHPEYYPKYLKNRDIDLIFAGHAHGGQWRLFGRGLFAPGQGLFPKYTFGFYDDRMIVSPGLANTVVVPRFHNAPGVVIVDIVSE